MKIFKVRGKKKHTRDQKFTLVIGLYATKQGKISKKKKNIENIKSVIEKRSIQCSSWCR
jgi:hypothetical protein